MVIEQDPKWLLGKPRLRWKWLCKERCKGGSCKESLKESNKQWCCYGWGVREFASPSPEPKYKKGRTVAGWYTDSGQMALVAMHLGEG